MATWPRATNRLAHRPSGVGCGAGLNGSAGVTRCGLVEGSWGILKQAVPMCARPLVPASVCPGCWRMRAPAGGEAMPPCWRLRSWSGSPAGCWRVGEREHKPRVGVIRRFPRIVIYTSGSTGRPKGVGGEAMANVAAA